MSNHRDVRSVRRQSRNPQKVVIVNGSAETLELLESTLDAGHYDVTFVDSTDHAYSHIRRVKPHLVVLCVRIEDVAGFQLLSMLKLDEGTRRIPVLTYTTEYEGQEAGGRLADSSDDDERLPAVGPALRLH
jgi:PleD family two-component response regulator